MLRNNLMLPTEALDIPEAIDFDGTNDYVGTAGALSSSINSATFTFSAFVYDPVGAGGSVYYAGIGRFHISVGGRMLTITGVNSSGTTILSVTVATNAISENTFAHILVSVDLANSANRRLYINDRLISTPWTTYTNGSINFANAAPNYVGTGSSVFKGRLAHVFLAYEYIDLSIEANRRLFITADRKPAANQQALNPILYLPLNDPTQPGKNLGTGGDFNLTGVVARSGRGPNQYNVPYSTLDGTADYLRRTSIVGIADGKQFSFSCVFNSDSTDAGVMFNMRTTSLFNSFVVRLNTNNCLIVSAQNAAGTTILSVSTANNSIVAGRNYVITVSCDLTDTSKRWLYLNGEAVSVTWTTYTNDTIDFTIPNYYVGLATIPTSGIFNGRLGALWFNTSYIDLSQASNLAKFVTGTGIDAKPVDLGANGELPFGTAPLIYLPMYGNNAGKNYGTGGDFSTNDGPYPGARGPNEFWGNKADFGSAAGRLVKNSALSGVSDGKTFSLCAFFNSPVTNSGRQISFGSYALGSETFGIGVVSGGTIFVFGRDSSGTQNLYLTAATDFSANTTYCLMISIDLGDSSKRYVYLDGISKTITPTTYTNSNIHFTGNAGVSIGGYFNGSSFGYVTEGWLAQTYFTTDYIDFSQEANRLKFRDAFGNPVDLTPQIKAGTLPNPAIYMRFDPANFGKNYGTGGDFTVNGIITDGGQL